MKKRSRIIVSVALAAVLALVGGVVAGDEVYFGYKFDENFSQAYKVKFNQELDAGPFVMSFFADMKVTEKCIGAGADEGTYLM